jgi:glutamyl-tRNA synthetase
MLKTCAASELGLTESQILNQFPPKHVFMELEELARKHALKNAVEYGGECNSGAVIGKIMSENDFRPEQVQQTAGKVCGEVNQLTLEEQKQEMGEYEYEEKEHEHDSLPDLQDAEEGEVVVRFAPNPNGPAHLGSARGMVVNGELKNKYGGELILRFDDTDPRKKRPLPEAYEMYPEDYEWLGYEIDKTLKSSEQFEKYYKHAEELIEMEKAYVCSCDPDKGSEYRKEGEACPHRDQSAEKAMKHWSKMIDGGIEEGEAVLKIKTDLDHKNPAVRDFVAFRIIENPGHPNTGDKYRVWPLLDFAGAIEDHYTETTHIVRGKDLRASTKRQKYIYDYLGWEYPNVRYWGRINISGFNAPMSTSSLGEMVESGELEGWDDPRAPTLRAVKKRGFRPEAIRNFFVEMGVTENDQDASVETLESNNRDIVDDEANRYFFVKNPVELEITGIPEDIKAEMPLHPDHEDRGTRNPDLDIRDGGLTVLVEEDDLEDGFLRLKGLCNLEISGQKAEYVEGDHTVALERDADIVHWAPETSEDAEVHMPDGEVIEGVVEPMDVEIDEVVQFERFGFARCDSTIEKVFYYAHE